MQEIKTNVKSIRNILRRARTYDQSIGRYTTHRDDGNGNFNVSVKNGSIIIPIDAVKMQQLKNQLLDTKVIYEISRGFKPVMESNDATNFRYLKKMLGLFLLRSGNLKA